MKIKHTIYLILLLFTILPLILFGSVMIYQNNKNIEETIEINLAAASGAQTLDIKNFSQTRKEYLETVSQLDLVRNSILASLGRIEPLPDKELNYLSNTLKSRLSAGTFSVSLSIIDKNFRVVASSSPHTAGETSILQEAEPRFLTGEFIFSNVMELNGGEKRIAVIIGIFNGEELIGYAVEELNLYFFEQIRTETNFWEDGTLYLMDGNGRLITAGNGEEASREHYVSTEEERIQFNERWYAIDFSAQPSGSLKYKVGKSQYITYYSTIRYTDWKLLLSINLSSFQQKKTAYVILTLTIVLAASVMLLLLNYFISVKLTKPVQGIIDTLRNIRETPDYTLRVAAGNNDEIGSLGKEINILLDDIEQEKILEQEHQRYLTRKAERDPLTGLYNREAVEEQLKTMLKDAAEQGRKAAIAILDVDDFKKYNTLYGHQGGDRVLKYIASLLSRINGCIAGRIGGDEFILGFTNADNLPDLNGCLALLLRQLNHDYSQEAAGAPVPIPCTIGMAIVGSKGRPYEIVFHKADEALYEAKAAGKNTFRTIAL